MIVSSLKFNSASSSSSLLLRSRFEATPKLSGTLYGNKRCNQLILKVNCLSRIFRLKRQDEENLKKAL